LTDRNPRCSTPTGIRHLAHACFFCFHLSWARNGRHLRARNLRGGASTRRLALAGTNGEEQNVFDDFIAAAEWLIANKYTSTPKAGDSWRQQGGLLDRRLASRSVLNSFGAALPEVGVMEHCALSQVHHRLAWTSDYGSSDKPERLSNGSTPTPRYTT